MRKGKRYIRTLHCRECGAEMYATASASQARKQGHIKDMWCPKCKKVTKFIDDGYKKWR